MPIHPRGSPRSGRALRSEPENMAFEKPIPALLTEGGQLEDPAAYVRPVCGLCAAGEWAVDGVVGAPARPRVRASRQAVFGGAASRAAASRCMNASGEKALPARAARSPRSTPSTTSAASTCCGRCAPTKSRAPDPAACARRVRDGVGRESGLWARSPSRPTVQRPGRRARFWALTARRAMLRAAPGPRPAPHPASPCSGS